MLVSHKMSFRSFSFHRINNKADRIACNSEIRLGIGMPRFETIWLMGESDQLLMPANRGGFFEASTHEDKLEKHSLQLSIAPCSETDRRVRAIAVGAVRRFAASPYCVRPESSN